VKRADLAMVNRLPRFLHVLTTIHAVGAVACFVMAAGSAISAEFRQSLAVSGGSTLMLDLFGASTSLFLLFVGIVLAVLAYGSLRLFSWAWAMTLVVYGIGVLGSLWQVSLGIRPGWISAVVNGAVFVYAGRRDVRDAYLGNGRT
jgi:hypothetical protein